VPEPPPEGFARSWYERYEARRVDGTGEAFAIAGDDGAFLGLALAPAIDEESAEAELGYIVAAPARGRGVASEALELLTRWAFDERGVQRAYLIIDVGNPASKRVAERAGYRLEGVMRNTYLKQGRRADTELWSRLPSDGAPNACSP
jgi:RimJ/RimL family protein N-acetyltransferase